MVENNNLPSNRIVIVEDPLHIPMIISKIQYESSRVQEPFYTFLKHEEEPSIIRGRNQPMMGKFSSESQIHLLGGIPEIKRQDGGGTWYHGSTMCLIKTYPKSNNRKIVDGFEQWHDEIREFYQGFLEEKLGSTPIAGGLYFQRGEADIYLISSGRQLFGTSASNDIWRTCWYEGDDTQRKSIIELARKDPQVVDIGAFERALGFVEDGFGEYVRNSIGFLEPISSGNFISRHSIEEAYQLQRRDGNIVGPCISGQYPRRATREEIEKMRRR